MMEHDQPIVLLAPRVTDDSKAIWKTCVDLGWSTARIQGWRVPEHLLALNRPLLIYGEPLFAEAVADQMGMVLLEPSIDWLVHVPREFVLRDIEILSLAEAREMNSEAFVKPANGKIFEPTVYGAGSELPTKDHVDGDIPVLRSDVVDFRLEVRSFVRERKVVSLSPYWREGELAIDGAGDWPFIGSEEAEATDFLNSVLGDDRVPLPPACTLDVGRLQDGAWAVIEANPCWGAGLYGCDPKAVLFAIGDAIVPRDRLKEGDRQWVSGRRSANRS